ncbi:hypothetical protein GCM10020258_14370 [Sphingomonas yabuuchiae]
MAACSAVRQILLVWAGGVGLTPLGMFAIFRSLTWVFTSHVARRISMAVPPVPHHHMGGFRVAVRRRSRLPPSAPPMGKHASRLPFDLGQQQPQMAFLREEPLVGIAATGVGRVGIGGWRFHHRLHRPAGNEA